MAWLVLGVGARAEIQISLRDSPLGPTYKSGGWTPLVLTLANGPGGINHKSDRDFSGRVQLLVNDMDGRPIRYVHPLELPLHAHKRIEIPVMLSRGRFDIDVELIDRRRGEVARQTFNRIAQGLAADDQREDLVIKPTVLLVSEPNEPVSFPTWVGNAFDARPIEVGDLPGDYKSYDGVRLVVTRRALSGPGRLNERQRKALETWIGLGGHLALITPQAVSELRGDPFLDGLLPARPMEAVAVERAEIEGVAAAGQSILMTRWEEIDPKARVAWDSPAGPLALAKRHGAGEVIAISIDPVGPGGSPDTLLGMESRRFLEGLIFAPHIEDLRARHYWSTANLNPDFSEVLLLPNLWAVSGILFLFVLVVGPLNFMLLRKARRLELAWVTIPALSVVFFVVIYGYGSAAKGGDQYYASAEILHLSSGHPDGLMLWNAIQFSPESRHYRLAAPRGTILPLMQYYQNPNDANISPTQAFGLNAALGATGPTERGRSPHAVATAPGVYELTNPVDQWQIAFYQGERPITIEGRIEGRVTLGLGPDGSRRWRVELANLTATRLEDAWVHLSNGKRILLGDVEPRSKIDSSYRDAQQSYRDARQNVPPEDAQYELNKFQRQADHQIRDGAVDSSLMRRHRPQRRCRLIARQTAWRSEAQVDPPPDQTKSLSMVEVDLPLRLEGEHVLTQDDLRMEVYYSEADMAFREAHEFLRLGTGQDQAGAQLVVAPPRFENPVEIIDASVTASVGSDVQQGPGQQGLALEVFDYQTGQWTGKTQRLNGPGSPPRDVTVRIPNDIPGDAFNPAGPLVRIQLAGTGVVRQFSVQMRVRGAEPTETWPAESEPNQMGEEAQP